MYEHRQQVSGPRTNTGDKDQCHRLIGQTRIRGQRRTDMEEKNQVLMWWTRFKAMNQIWGQWSSTGIYKTDKDQGWVLAQGSGIEYTLQKLYLSK